ALGVRRSFRRQISSLLGRLCPSLRTSNLSTSFFASASTTRRTMFRSLDQKCRRHLLYSPEIEYLASPRSKVTAPSSTTTASREPARNSSTVRTRLSGVIREIVATGNLHVCDR